MNMIEIQQAYIDRVLRAHNKQGPRSAGLVFARTKRAARVEGIKALVRKGFTDAQAADIMQQAHDMFVLERDARPSRHGYSPVAVNKAIEASNRAGRRISGREARAIHALLAGR